MSARRALAALLAALACGVPASVLAHKPSDAYLNLRLADAGAVTQRLDIALRDLDRDLGLDRDGDGAITWGEVRSAWPEVEAWSAGQVRLSQGGQPCEAGAAQAPQIDEHVDGHYLVLQRDWRCAAGAGPLTLHYQLFERTDALHRGLLSVQDAHGQTLQTRVLSAQAQGVALGGVAGGASGAQALPGFIAEGLGHIAAGADHLLFILTLLLAAVWRREAAQWRPRSSARAVWGEALRLVTAFTLAHSLTLSLAAAGVLAPPTRWVESLIALSVALAALDNLRPFLPGPRWAAAGLFGLVHGFGFAGPLQDLGLQGRDLLWPLLGFNLGVELGQLLVVGLVLPLALVWRAAPAYRRWVVQPASAVVAVVALVWTVERVLA